MLQLRPTFSESWYRVANLKVRLRPSAQISRQYYRGERWYVVRDPAGNQYHRLSDPAYRFVALLDGARSINEAWEIVGGKMDDEAPTQPEVIQILNQLYSANLIEADVTPDSQVLLKRHKKLMQKKLQQRLMSILFPRIPIWDPDRFLRRWMPVFGPMMSWAGAILWLVVVGLALVALAPKSAELAQSARDSISPGNWAWLWLIFVLTKFIHEMGHAYACRRFGGECHEMGVMFLVFIPTPYVDASSAWSFPSRWARIYVGAAGMVVEIFFAALCAFIWLNTGRGELINQLAYNAMLIASVSTVLFNANPLLRYDGYYILSDFLEIPNLQKKSTDYTMGLIKRHVFGVKAREPLPNVSTRLWLFFYAITSTTYRVFIGILIIVLVAFQVPVLGILMSIGGIITWLGMPLFKSLKYLMVEPELHRKRAKAWAWTLAGVGLVVILLGLIPFPLRVRAEGVVEPVVRDLVHTNGAGFVRTLHVRDGQTVAAGDLLLSLGDDQLSGQHEEALANRNAAEIKVRASRATNPAQAIVDETELELYSKQVKDLEGRLARLEVRAAVGGQVIGPQLVELSGRWVPRGQQVMMVASLDALWVRSLVTQDDAELIRDTSAGRTQVRVASAVGTTLAAKRVEVVSAGSEKLPHPLLSFAGGGEIQSDPSDPQGMKSNTKQFELRVTLPMDVKIAPLALNFDPQSPSALDLNTLVLPGQRAFVRVNLEPRPIAWQAWRRFQQLIQAQKDTKWL